MPAFRYKLQISGNVIVEKFYEKYQYANYTRDVPRKKRDLTDGEKEENRRRSALRARKSLIDAVNANFGWVRRGFRYGEKSVKFLTLTYKENMTDYARLASDFDRFKKRIEYHLSESIQYVCVPEQQKRGAWHLHILFYSSFLPLDTLKRLWNETQGQGGFNVKRVQHVHNVGQYIGKYISKDFAPNDALSGKKRFWCSQGFTNRSSVFRLPAKPDMEILQTFRQKKAVASCYESEYEGEHTGKVRFRRVVVFPSAKNHVMMQDLIEHLGWEQKENDPVFIRLLEQARFAALPHAMQQFFRRRQQCLGKRFFH